MLNNNMNKEMIEGLRLIVSGLASYVEGLAIMNNVPAQTGDFCRSFSSEIVSTEGETAEPIVEETSETPEVFDEEEEPVVETETEEEEPAVEIEEEEPEEEEPEEDSELPDITEDKLSEMSYNDLKKLAKSLNVTAVGTRAEIVKKILDAVQKPADKSSEPPVKKSPIKKSAPPVVEEEPEEESEDEPDDTDEDDDSVESKVLAAVEDMSDEEIRELLESYDISGKGKRQALISKLVEAVEDGTIEFDEEDSEDEDESEVEPEDEDDEDNYDEDDSEDVTANMTEERKKAYEELCDETTSDFNSGETTRTDLIDFLNDFYGEKNKYKGVSDTDVLTKYLETVANLVSDEGEVVEEGAYTINDVPYCCGRPLDYNAKRKVYHCSCCDSDYEVED